MLMPVPFTEVPVQLPMGGQLTRRVIGSYITNAQVHNSSNIPICISDSEAHDNVKVYFKGRFNDKIYSTFKELFDHVNIVYIREVWPKIDTYNNTIAWYVEDINLTNGVALSYNTGLRLSGGKLSVATHNSQSKLSKTNNNKLSRFL